MRLPLHTRLQEDMTAIEGILPPLHLPILLCFTLNFCYAFPGWPPEIWPFNKHVNPKIRTCHCIIRPSLHVQFTLPKLFLQLSVFLFDLQLDILVQHIPGAITIQKSNPRLSAPEILNECDNNIKPFLRFLILQNLYDAVTLSLIPPWFTMQSSGTVWR